mgnify:CR=1 FL=1
MYFMHVQNCFWKKKRFPEKSLKRCLGMKHRWIRKHYFATVLRSMWIRPNRSATKKLRSGSVPLRTMQNMSACSRENPVWDGEGTDGRSIWLLWDKKTAGRGAFRYYFEIRSGSEVCYYNRCGVSERVVSDYDYVVCPGFCTPKWAKGAVMYQIFTDRFCNGAPDNDVEDREYYYIGDYSRKVTDWNAIRQPWMCGNSMVEI